MTPSQAFWLMAAVTLLAATIVSGSNSTVINEETKINGTKEILKASETSDPQKVEIVKQIRRLNDDGSYTVGYEAEDGTFKIESRDVRGNVKGTFGYIDRDGEIKRVTYSSSSSTTPVPVTSSSASTLITKSTTTSKPNKSFGSSTRRPLPTVVYPRGSHSSTRGTVIQPIPRKKYSLTEDDSSMEKDKIIEATTSNIKKLYKEKHEDPMTPMKIQTLRPQIVLNEKEELEAKKNADRSKIRSVRPDPESFTDTSTEKDALQNMNKSNTIRRELTSTKYENPHMFTHLQQSVGDDSTDVYGSHLSLGTVRPLFTTTTARPQLIPFQSILANRQKLQERFANHIRSKESEQETTIEASTGRVFDHENVVTSNPVPVVQIPGHRDQGDERIYNQPVYQRQFPTVQFRTREYLRDNPGAAVPIGNQRQILSYNLQPQARVLEPQFIRETTPQQQLAQPKAPEASYPYVNQITRIIPIPVDDRGVPVSTYQGRFNVNPYVEPQHQPPPVSLPHPILRQRVPDASNDMNSIAPPVSTRDLRRLLHLLLIRQNRLQTLMDEIASPGPPYQPLPLFRVNQPQIQQNYVPQYQNFPARQYKPEEDQYYRNDQSEYRPDVYSNQIGYETHESQRFLPRRRLYGPYDSTSQGGEAPEYLPPEVREALLLKMLMLAISPDFVPSPAPPTELTTATPPKKQVRNVQILGEEGSVDEQKRRMMHRH